MALRAASQSARSLRNASTGIFSFVARGTEAGPSQSSECLAAACQWQQTRWASKKQGGSTQNNKDSQPKYLGLKLFGGQLAAPGNIIVRQRGTEFHPGLNVGMGKDHTIFSLVDGHVKFTKDKRRKRTFINVQPRAPPATATQTTATP